jgi:hypothetical protein
MIGLSIKSMKISILKQKKRKLYGFQIKFCEDKKLRFCDAPRSLHGETQWHSVLWNHLP